MHPAATLPADVAELPPAAEPCLNCAQPLLAGAGYCPHCGQPRPHRLSTAHVLHEILHVFTHADKSIVGFVGQVLLHPGRVVRDYLAGRRKRYFNPFQFLLLAVGVATVLAVQLHYYERIGEQVQHTMQAHGAPAAVLARVGRYFHAVGKFFNVWWLGLMPVHALVAWAVYRRRLNYAESFFVLVVIGSAFQLLLILALVSVFLFVGLEPGSSTALLQGLVYFGYLSWIGRGGLELSWPRALGSALAVSLLAGLINFGANWVAFWIYVMHFWLP
ncbi:DUF3667 domain-containing protein [Hymenobacter sp. 15J16-1T3B]|uniref:DUF3667 domain-containing protein n=1 Tax=Hymenobacter sp. 15J16-1T3B TaxID=2886941 RepID=UPI001D116A5D|nr:DUF3667 domain-containing protein [Hymenobacter sp. 15J16-1T3B]MCC3158361.1 DUF3667 domain-containing protein [Hymenobacter sp. 15J16-1T3B]